MSKAVPSRHPRGPLRSRPRDMRGGPSLFGPPHVAARTTGNTTTPAPSNATAPVAAFRPPSRHLESRPTLGKKRPSGQSHSWSLCVVVGDDVLHVGAALTTWSWAAAVTYIARRGSALRRRRKCSSVAQAPPLSRWVVETSDLGVRHVGLLTDIADHHPRNRRPVRRMVTAAEMLPIYPGLDELSYVVYRPGSVLSGLRRPVFEEVDK